MPKEKELQALASLYRRVTNATEELDQKVVHADRVIEQVRTDLRLRPLRHIAIRD